MNRTTGPLLIKKAGDREQIFKSWTSKQPLLVHAEGETIEVAIKLAKKYKTKLHICHLTSDQLRSFLKAKSEGLVVTSEVTPHHLFLSKNDLYRLGPYGIMKPGLEDKRGQKKLWANLDKIDMISTDHAPHTIAEKSSQPTPFGVTGLETTLPLMLGAVWENKISLERFIDLTCSNPRRIFNLPNQPDTYVLVDSSKVFTICSKKLFTKCAWTPFEELTGRGEIVEVVIRGKLVFRNGKFTEKPSGQIIFPTST